MIHVMDRRRQVCRESRPYVKLATASSSSEKISMMFGITPVAWSTVTTRLGSPGWARPASAAAGVANSLFAAFAFVVLLGTIFPLIVEAVDGRTISVGNPYFETMTMPIGLTTNSIT